MRHRPELDGLRGIAVILVIGSHAWIPGFGLGAPAGVTLFFVLSGFLITSLLVSERERTGRVDLVAFYMRRALRLLPALYAFVLVTIVGYGLGLWANKPADPFAIVAVLGYVGNWASAAGVEPGMFGHTWSLAVEEQFYILWPAVLLLALRLGERRTTAIVLLSLAILVLPWREFVMNTGGYLRAYVGTDTQADALFFGCAIALLGTRLPSWAGWLGIAGLVAVAEKWGNIVPFFSLSAVASALAVAGCPAALGWRPLAYIGRISYGLYLWHYLFIWSGIPWPVAIAATLATASISYRYLEQPFLRLKERRFARAGRGSTSSPALPAVVAESV